MSRLCWEVELILLSHWLTCLDFWRKPELLHPRPQGPFLCCLLLLQTLDCYWLIQWSNPVSIGSPNDPTSFQSSSLYLRALGKHCFVKMSSSTLCCTVFLYNVFELKRGHFGYTHARELHRPLANVWRTLHKEVVPRDFWPSFFPSNRSSWAPDSWVKNILLKNLFSWSYLSWKI